MNRRRILRVARFVLLLAIVLAAAWFLRTYEKYTIPEADNSMEPAYPAGSTVLAKVLAADAPLERGADVVWAMERDGEDYARYGRVQAVAGDDVGARDGQLTVNGEPIGPIPVAGEPMGRVPDGKVLILATTPVPSPHYPDSRQLGFIARDRVRAVITFRFSG